MAKKSQLGRFLGKTLDNLDKKVLLNNPVHFAKDFFHKLAIKVTSSAIDKLERQKWTRCCKRRERLHFIYFK